MTAPFASDAEIEALRARACVGKARYSCGVARRYAESLRAGGESISPYRCPFGDGDPHWHVGHALSIDGLAQLARVMRERLA